MIQLSAYNTVPLFIVGYGTDDYGRSKPPSPWQKYEGTHGAPNQVNKQFNKHLQPIFPDQYMIFQIQVNGNAPDLNVDLNGTKRATGAYSGIAFERFQGANITGGDIEILNLGYIEDLDMTFIKIGINPANYRGYRLMVAVSDNTDNDRAYSESVPVKVMDIGADTDVYKLARNFAVIQFAKRFDTIDGNWWDSFCMLNILNCRLEGGDNSAGAEESATLVDGTTQTLYATSVEERTYSVERVPVYYYYILSSARTCEKAWVNNFYCKITAVTPEFHDGLCDIEMTVEAINPIELHQQRPITPPPPPKTIVTKDYIDVYGDGPLHPYISTEDNYWGWENFKGEL